MEEGSPASSQFEQKFGQFAFGVFCQRGAVSFQEKNLYIKIDIKKDFLRGQKNAVLTASKQIFAG